MFNLFSLFRSKPSLPDDVTITQHIPPYAKLELADGHTIAVYRTRTRLFVTDPIVNFFAYFSMPRGSSLKLVASVAEIYFKGHTDGWEGYRLCQPIFDEGAAQRAAWLAIPEEERRLYEPEDPELVQYYRDHPEEGIA